MFFLFFKTFGFIYLFMAVLGLCFCARAFSSCGKRGPLIIAASLVAEHRLQTRRLSNCGSRAQLLHGMWDLPRPGLEPVSRALAGRFATTAPLGKPSFFLFKYTTIKIQPVLLFELFSTFKFTFVSYTNLFKTVLCQINENELFLIFYILSANSSWDPWHILIN